MCVQYVQHTSFFFYILCESLSLQIFMLIPRPPFYLMIIETRWIDIVELVNCRACQFRATFCALLSVTLNVVALCNDVSLALVI